MNPAPTRRDETRGPRRSRAESPIPCRNWRVGRVLITTTEKCEQMDRGCVRSASRSGSAGGRACWDHSTTPGHSGALRLVLQTQPRSGGSVKQLSHLGRRKKKVTLRVSWKKRTSRDWTAFCGFKVRLQPIILFAPNPEPN